MGQVRIIAGQWRRRQIPVPDRLGLRPTPDRVRETLFNWLEHLLDRNWSEIHVLDVFAGTGALGFEAGSRGARQVTLVDQDRSACMDMQRLALTLRADPQQMRVVQAEGISQLERSAEASLDLIFLDPPFRQGLIERALGPAARALRPGGLVYSESERPVEHWVETLAPHSPARGLVPMRSLKAGQVMVGLLCSEKVIAAESGDREVL
ncbi:MAG: 16S rRNA (guanine(966)-N(2))-methyltransferase RsmD [Burkholderiaceae bacterium]